MFQNLDILTFKLGQVFFQKKEKNVFCQTSARRVYATITLDQLTELFSARENHQTGDAIR
jgi:hypothetical protein